MAKVDAEEKAGDLVWTVYCLDCEETLDNAVNGSLMQAVAEIHARKTGHRVLLGNVFTRR